MTSKFDGEIARIISLATREAKSFNHEYVGTEHLLLALAQEESGAAAEALRTFGVSADDIRAGIEKLVQRGPAEISADELPLTPRARRAIQFAIEDAKRLLAKQPAGEHLLVGLLREETGVAGQVLLSRGLKLRELAAEAFMARLSQ